MRIRVLAFLAVTTSAAPAFATDYDGTDANYRTLLGQLQPGDTLRLAAGTYTRGLPLVNVNGTEDAPIVITGPETGPRAIINGRACCNTISLRGVSWVVIRHLDVDGQGELVDGVKAESDGGSVHHVTLEHLDIYNLGNDQQVVGINTKLPTWGWIIRHNTIRDAGTGMYFGGSDGSWPFIGAVIEHNLVVNPLGYCMEIKHQVGRPNVEGIPTADSTTVIRHNVFMKYDRATMGENARTNIYVGAQPQSGPGANDRFEIYGNFFYQNQTGTQALVQGEGNVSFHDNLLVNSFGDGAWWVRRDGPPKEIHAYNNTIYVMGTGVRISGQDTGAQQLVIGNAIFAQTPVNGGTARDNATGAPQDSVSRASFELGMLDLYPKAGRLLGSAISLAAFQGETDHDRDFNGALKDGRRRGAYAGEGTNPGWAPAEEIKPERGGPGPAPDAGTTPPRDAGTTPPRDAGTTPRLDAGTTPRPDAGAAGSDAGTAAGDSGAVAGEDGAPGGSTSQLPRGTSGSCGCHATAPAARGTLAASLLALAVAAATRRRYRRAR